MTEVHTRDEAIALVDDALETWSANVSGVLTQAQSVVRAACDRVEAVVRRRANEVAALEALLAGARPDERRAISAQLVRAREASDQARRVSVRVRDIQADVLKLARVHTGATAALVESARSQLSSMNEALERYRSGTAAGGAWKSSHPRSTAPSVIEHSLGPDFSILDVSAADLEENPILDGLGPGGTFGRGGLSRADYRWAVQTWNDIVGPGVASGETRDTFADRDARSNARPLRRAADVYDIFLGDDRIRAERRSDGSLNIVNGRHRLAIARELGIRALPGEVR